MQMTSSVAKTGEPSQLAGIDFVEGRRAFMRSLGLGALGAGIVGFGGTEALAQSAPISDVSLFAFALNFEYLGAEFYLRATTGKGLPDNLIQKGSSTPPKAPGPVTGGRQINFKSSYIQSYAEELARDEMGHVVAVRSALGPNAVPRPAIDIGTSFTMAARAAGIVGNNGTFDPYDNDVNFLLAAFIFEDVCVTVLHGAAPLINRKANLAAAAGILATEGYQAGMIRTTLYGIAAGGNSSIFGRTQKISDLRAKLDGTLGKGRDDQGISFQGRGNITPVDANSIVFSRTPRQALNIAYGAVGASSGLFFPEGVNGSIK